MALHLFRGHYSNAAFQGMLATPLNRGDAATAIFKTVGIKTHEILYSVSTGEIVCLIEGSGEQITEIEMITMASGVFSSVSSEELISTKTMVDVMKSAGANASKFKPPNK